MKAVNHALWAVLALATALGTPATAEETAGEATTISVSGNLADDMGGQRIETGGEPQRENPVRPASREEPAHVFSDSGSADVAFATDANSSQAGEASCSDAACRPLWTIDAGALVLHRSSAIGQPSTVIARISDRAILADSASLDPGWAAGPDIRLIRRLGDALDVEARYFGIDGWSSSATAGDPNGVVFDGFNVAGFSQTQQMNYWSRLYSIELNGRGWCRDWFPLVFGFRTMQLHEHFQLNSLAPTLVTGIDTTTNNFLYGLQIGAEPVFWNRGGKFRAAGLIKAGVYDNLAAQNTRFPTEGLALGAERHVSAFVGELGLTGSYSITERITLRGGYQVMWLSNMALAPDQGATTFPDPLPGAAYVNTTATPFYHGAMFSIERTF
jgi:hypothetical protein